MATKPKTEPGAFELDPAVGANRDITEAITGGTLERTMSGASTLTLNVHDPHRRLVNAKALTHATDIQVAGDWYRLVKITKQGDGLTLVFEDRDVAFLRAHTRPRKVSRNKMTRAQFVRSLVKEVKAHKIKFFCPELNVKQPIVGSAAYSGSTARGKAIFYVGDSLAVGTHPTLDGLVGATDYNGVVGRNSTDTLTYLETYLKSSHKVVVFDAGSNDTSGATLKANLQAAKEAVGDRPLYALTVNSPPNTDALNKAIRDAGVRVIDWHSYVKRQKIPLDSMGIHPNAAGYKKRAGLIADAIKGATKTSQVTTKTETERNENRDAGLPDDFTIKTIVMTRQKRKDMQTAMDVATELKANRKATRALLCAGFGESQFDRSLSDYKTHTHKGIWQSNQIPPDQVAEQAKYFLLGGRSFGAGGAIKLSKQTAPRLTPGGIATMVEVSGMPATFYDAWINEANQIIEAYGGPPAEGSTTTTTTTSVTRRKYEFTRGKPGEREDSWTAIQRLAGEVGWHAFMDNGTLYYISENELMKSKPRYVLDEDTPGIHTIDFDVDQGKVRGEVRIQCAAALEKFRIGTVVQLKNLGIANGRWLVSSVRQDLFDPTVTEVVCKTLTPKLPEPAAETKTTTRTTTSGDEAASGGDKIKADRRGAKGIVDDAAALATRVGGSKIYVGSALRPGAVTTSGNPSDHGFNNSSVAARDIGKRGVDLIVGPPSDELDTAVVAIGEAFGKHYTAGDRIVDEFHWHGYRIQIIWRTPEYGGHMGHIHIGANKNK